MPRGRTIRRWWLWYLVAGAVAAVLLVVFHSPDLHAVLETGGGGAAVVAVAAGIRRHRPRRTAPWRLLQCAVGAGLLISLSLAWYQPTQWYLDLLYYAPFLPLLAALAYVPVRQGHGAAVAGMVEAGIITCGATLLWWMLLVDQLIFDKGRSPGAFHVLLYPMLDIAALALALRLLLITRARAHLLILLAIAVLLVGDSASFVASLGSAETPLLTGVCWVLTYALLGAGALHPSMAHEVPPSRMSAAQQRIIPPRLYIATVMLTPIITGAFLLEQVAGGGLDTNDVLVPIGITTISAGLVVVRILQLNRLADARAAALEVSLQTEDELQQELRHRAQHDLLTGLPNRSLLHDRIAAALAAGAPGALFVLDVDAFKDVNDRFGHTMGDDLLLAVAARLAERLSEPLGGREVLARLDSDEFAVLMADLEPAGAVAIAEDLLAAMRRPLRVQGMELFATVSIGLRDLDPDLPTTEILRDAYLALHSAKGAGGDQLALFDGGLRERRLAAARTLERLRGAIDREELVLHYQPLIQLADERMVGVEALVRWEPRGELLIPPDRFIPAAEDSGLIVPIGAWVLREACHMVAEWHRRTGVVASVNVSPRQLREPDFGVQVLDALRSSGLPPEALILEITEGVLVANGQVAEQATLHLSMLRERGVQVAIDDFGTGYSSLAYLRDLPIDQVKIDKSFMPASGEPEPATRTMLKAVIDLAAGLGLSTLAEGVETAEQAALLRELGCQKAQGFYFSRPLPAPEAAVLLAATFASTGKTRIAR